MNNFNSDRKSVSDGGFGGAPGFPILSDRDLSFSGSCGVARWVIKAIANLNTAALSRQGVWLSCQGNSHRGLVGQLALHGRSQDRHPQVLHVALLVPVDSHLCAHTCICSLQFFCISRNVTEILRLVQAFRHSDLTGHVSLNHPILSPAQSVENWPKSILYRLCHLTGLQGVRSSRQTSLTRCPKCLALKGNQD